MTMSPSQRSSTIKVGLIGLALSASFSAWILHNVGWDVTIFTAFGDESTAITEYAEKKIGPVFNRIDQGHDGKYFFVQANDPWVLNPSENAMIMDRPVYRSQRMLYPVLASGGGILGPGAIVWTLLLVNILAMGIGSWATAGVAVNLGGSPWWGLSFTLNLGLTSEVNISGAGVVATAAAFAAIYLLSRNKVTSGITWLTVAALSREVMLVAAAGAAVWLFTRKKRSIGVAVFAVPLLFVVLWGLYLRYRLGWETGAGEVQEIGLPFVGLWEALGVWTHDLLDLIAGGLIVGIMISFASRAVRSRTLVGFSFVGFVFIGLLLTVQVWSSYYDITRALAPIITAFVLLAFASRTKTSRPADAT